MKDTTSKESVLKSIRDALVRAMPSPFEAVDQETAVFSHVDGDLKEEQFAEAFIEAYGKFVFCADVEELAENISTLLSQKDIQNPFCGEDFLTGLLQAVNTKYTEDHNSIENCDASITGCEALIARHGTIVFSSRQGGNRKSFIVPPINIVVATNQQLVGDPGEVFRYLKIKYGDAMPSWITFVTGPSRTADVEKKLVQGAHGPKELYLFMLDTSSGQTD